MTKATFLNFCKKSKTQNVDYHSYTFGGTDRIIEKLTFNIQMAYIF